MASSACAVTARLGWWQLDRAQQKLDLQARITARGQLPPLPQADLPRSAEDADRHGEEDAARDQGEERDAGGHADDGPEVAAPGPGPDDEAEREGDAVKVQVPEVVGDGVAVPVAVLVWLLYQQGLQMLGTDGAEAGNT